MLHQVWAMSMPGVEKGVIVMPNVKGRRPRVNEQDVVDLDEGDRISKEREIWI